MEFPFLAGDPLAYTMMAIKHCRRRFYPFLWAEWDRRNLMDHTRSLAWLILNEDQPQTKRNLWNAVQRKLYAEAKNDGWHRARSASMHYDQRVRPAVAADIAKETEENDTPMIDDLLEQSAGNSGLRGEITTALQHWLSQAEFAILLGLIGDQTEQEIAEALGANASEIVRLRRSLRAKLKSKSLKE